MSNKATMANRPRGSYRHQHDTRQARGRSVYLGSWSAHSFDIKPMYIQSQTLCATNTFTREQTYVTLRTYERVWTYAQCVPSNRTSVCFYFCRTYKIKAHRVPNLAQFQPYLGLNQCMHRKRIIVRSYITLLKMIDDTSFTSTLLLRGCELLCTRGLQYIAAYHSLVY